MAYNPEEYILNMIFENQLGNNVTLSLSSPKENLTEEVVRQAMQTICDNRAIYGSGLSTLVKPVAAKIVKKDYMEFEPTVG